MTDEAKGVIKAELTWALRAVKIALGIIGGLLGLAGFLVGMMWNGLSATQDEIKAEVKELRYEVQTGQVASASARAGLENRITRLEAKLDLNP